MMPFNQNNKVPLHKGATRQSQEQAEHEPFVAGAPPISTAPKWFPTWSTVMTNVLIVGLASLCVYLVFRPFDHRVLNHDDRHAHGTITGNMVSLPTRAEVLQFEQIYAEPPANWSDQAWADLIPQGKGFVSVEKLRRADVAGTESLGLHGETKYCVSVFHQLHCLYMLRSGFYAAQEGTMPPEHMKHCFDYLRQTIMCNADGALEPYKDEHRGVDGYDAMRQCKDYGTLYEFAGRYRSNDNFGIV